jgi:DHA2 family methylenomycin A resistance protein-like MFS transporter
VVQLDVTVVNVALQHIEASLKSSVAGLQWVVNAYTLSFAALILTAGGLGDRFGAKRIFIAGFATFVAGSIGCGFAPTLSILVAARAIQGAGAAILVPCSLTLLNHAYQEEDERGKAIGIWAAGASVALAAGPVVGGLLIAAVGWRSIFFLNIPIGAAGIWLTIRYAQESPRSQTSSIDLAGQFIGIFVLADLAAALINAGARGWTNPLIVAGLILAAVGAAAFVFVEAKVKNPMLPLSLFQNLTFSAATLIGLLTNIAFYGLLFVLSLFFQQLRHYTALRTGLAFLPMTSVVLAANLISPRISMRFGPRVPILIGQLLAAAGCITLIGTTQSTSYAALCAQLLAIGAGLGLVVPPMTSALLGTVDRRRSGIASGVLNTARQAGSVAGVALFGSLVAAKNHFVPGMHLVLLISGALLVSGGLVAFMVAPNEPHTH